MNPELRELITIDQATALVNAIAWIAVAVALAAVAAAMLAPSMRRRALLVAAAAAPWSLFLSVGWRVYLWRVRFDPATGFCGLHSVRVLATNALAAVIIGLLYGLFLRWVIGLLAADRGESKLAIS